MSDVEQMLTDIRFYEQVIGDAKRTIYCEPSVAAAVRDAVEAHGAGRLFTVVASLACPEGKLIVADNAALEASFNEAMQRMTCDWRF